MRKVKRNNPTRIFNGDVLEKVCRDFFREDVEKLHLTIIVGEGGYTVKLARANLPENTGNFTCSSQVKRPHTQFICVTCSLPVKTGKFTCVDAAITSRRMHAIWLQVHVNLPEGHGYFTGNFTCGTHANFPSTSMQNCLLLQAKIHATCRQKH